MSEQRFEFYSDEYLIGVLDTVTGKTFDSFAIVDKLNEQQSKIDDLEKNFDDLVKFSSEIAKRNVILDEKIGKIQKENEKLKEEEKLYAQEILRLNNLLKQYQTFEDLAGDY